MKRCVWQMMMAGAVSLLMIVAGLFFTLSSVINDRQFFHDEYSRINNAAMMGLTTDDLADATMRMIHYMEGKEDSIDIKVTIHGELTDMFNDRERAHMVDVRILYLSFKTAAFIFCGLYALMLAVRLFHKKSRFSVALSFLYAGAVFAALILIIGLWAAIDFSSFWTAFHHVFFTNDLWLLDPNTSRMINMMPEQLFSSIVSVFIVRFVLIWLAFSAIAAAYCIRRRQKEARP